MVKYVMDKYINAFDELIKNKWEDSIWDYKNKGKKVQYSVYHLEYDTDYGNVSFYLMIAVIGENGYVCYSTDRENDLMYRCVSVKKFKECGVRPNELWYWFKETRDRDERDKDEEEKYNYSPDELVRKIVESIKDNDSDNNDVNDNVKCECVYTSGSYLTVKAWRFNGKDNKDSKDAIERLKDIENKMDCVWNEDGKVNLKVFERLMNDYELRIG